MASAASINETGTHVSSQLPRVRHEIDIATIGTGLGERPAGISALPKSFLKQILGLNPFKTSYFSLFRPLQDPSSKILLACGVIFAAAAGVPLPIVGVIFGKLIDSFPPDEDQLKTYISQLLGVAVAYFVVTWIWAVCWGIIGERVSRGLREQLVERALGMDMAYFEVESSDITSQLTADTQAIQLGVSEKVGLFIQSISYFITAFIIGFILNAKLTGILFAAVIPLMATVIIGGTTTVSRLSRKATSFTESATSIAEGAIRAVMDVQAFGAAGRLSDEHMRALSRAAEFGIKKSLAGAVLLASVYFVAYAANALAFWQGAKMISEGAKDSSAGTVYAVVFLILDASFVIGQFGPFIQTFALAAAAGRNVFALLDHDEAHINVYSEEGVKATKEDLNQDIHLHRVNFVYPARPTVRVLENVDLHIQAGKLTGVVGASGSGKSTITALLLRFYDPSSGKVTIGSRDIREFNVASLRSQISIVKQDPVLFSGSILDNVRHGLGDCTLPEEVQRERCIQAIRDSNAWQFAKTLPQGVDTMIGNSGGTQLSGGQKQRICLARALVGDPALLILDEFTSALDSESERLVMEALNRDAATSSRTTIMIAHRLATIKKADQIIVFGQGALLEQGTHDELMIRETGPYRALVQAQKLDHDHHSQEATISKPEDQDDEKLRRQSTLGDTGQPEHTATADKTQKKHRPTNTMALIRRCFMLSRAQWPFLFAGLTASIITGGIIIGEALVFGNLIQVLNSDEPNMLARANMFSLIFLILAIVALLAYSTSGTCFGIVAERLVQITRDISLRTILTQDMEWFTEPGHSAHALMSTLSMDAGHLSGLSGVILGTVFTVITSITGGIVLAHVVAWRIAIVLLAAVPIMVMSGFMRLRILAQFEQRHETAYNAAAALASEACTSITTVAALGREKGVLREYKAAIHGPYKESIKFSAYGNLFLAMALAITYFVYALAYWWGSKQVREGHYSTLQFFIVLPALLFSAQSCGQMFSLAPEVTRAVGAAANVFELHDQKPTIGQSPPSSKCTSEKSGSFDSERFSGSLSLVPQSSRPRGQIEFRDVGLVYPTRPNAPAFTNLSFTIEAGEFVAFVGPSGAGKSSAVSLLERFIDPTSGAVLIDGVDIKTLPVEKHRERLSFVAQEPSMFAGTIAFNVGLGARTGHTATQEEIEIACRSCEIHDFIMDLPRGYQTDCGANGLQLSGGQRQRLALARAVLRSPEVLLLDEATSALDAHSEAAVQHVIAPSNTPSPAPSISSADQETPSAQPKQIHHKRTTIVVAHRLASVQRADRIFVFDHGKIIEVGKHEELIAQGGVYANLVRAQALPGL